MKAFITGATGFIGGQVARKLLARGDTVYALTRSEQGAQEMRLLGAIPVRGDISDPDSLGTAEVLTALKACDVLFHIAAWYKLGSSDAHLAEKINVDGTQHLLTLAYRLGVPKIVYTSTVAVYGDTHGRLVDENDPLPPALPRYLTEYDRTKWMAHAEVVLPLIRQGAPIVIVMPGAVYGPGDTSLVGQMMRLFVRGLLPVLPGPELTLTFAHVSDVADGHLLAAEKGRSGQSYILAGPVFAMGEMVQVWAVVTGRPAPLFHVPARYLKPLLPLVEFASRYLPLPELISRDSITILEASYIARSEKARRELGWRTRPIMQGMRQTFEWMQAQPGGQGWTPPSRRTAAAIVLSLAMGLLGAWLVRRRR